ncbi:MAG: hypothetical protein II649_09140 [Kiritimatiellae bacterium]|nr:hypothetical protein [Kiritimatiellia bacterium]
MMRFLCIVPSIFNFLHLRRQLPCSIALNHPVAPLWYGGRAKRVTAIAATAAVARLCTLHCSMAFPFICSFTIRVLLIGDKRSVALGRYSENEFRCGTVGYLHVAHRNDVHADQGVIEIFFFLRIYIFE